MRVYSYIYLGLGIIGVIAGLVMIGVGATGGDSSLIGSGVIFLLVGLWRGGLSVARIMAYNQSNKNTVNQAQRILYNSQLPQPGYPPQQPAYPPQYGQPGQPSQYGQPGYPPQYGQQQYGQPEQPNQYGQPAYPPQPGQYGQPGQSSQWGGQFPPQQPTSGDIPPNPYNQR